VTDEITRDPAGTADTHFSRPSAVDPLLTEPLGVNGRLCETCHVLFHGWTVSPGDPDGLPERFSTTAIPSAFGGVANVNATSNDQLDPIFRPVDGANSPAADLSSPAARATAYSMLLAKAVIRVGEPVPSNAEFTLAAVDDPYGYASARELSLFRRPLPAANLRFVTTVMWDGRETGPCQTLTTMLAHQANDAALTHAQATANLSDDATGAIVSFERTIYFAQTDDDGAGPLDAAGATGGVTSLVSQPFYVGINAFPGPDPKGLAFSTEAFTLFDAWGDPPPDQHAAARRAIARGEALFNTRTFAIRNVKGLNDELGQASVSGTCTTCHNTPNVGSNSMGMLFDTGVADGARRSSDQPLYTLTNVATGETLETTDPGRALVTGAWKDVGRFKVPVLRGLAARAPYFHDGSAATIADVIAFDDARFAIGLSESEKSDLAAFLGAL
jgi:hypothetical protein